jgi:hypothetical protein
MSQMIKVRQHIMEPEYIVNHKHGCVFVNIVVVSLIRPPTVQAGYAARLGLFQYWEHSINDEHEWSRM